MHPKIHAQTQPDKPAVIMATSGETVTYREREARPNQGAHLFRTLGLKVGDVAAILMDNHPRFLEVAWAAQRAGLYYTCISSKLAAGEIEYIVKDSGSQALIASPGVGAALDDLPPLVPGVKLYMVGQARGPYESYGAAIAAFPTTPITDEAAGSEMLYSSGTTGRPKGVKPPLTGEPLDAPNSLTDRAQALFEVRPGDVYLSPAPLYHAAPLRYS